MTSLQAVDDVGVQGMDRVDRLAGYLVELRKDESLTLSNQQVSNIYVTQYSLFSVTCSCSCMYTHVVLCCVSLCCVSV